MCYIDKARGLTFIEIKPESFTICGLVLLVLSLRGAKNKGQMDSRLEKLNKGLKLLVTMGWSTHLRLQPIIL